MSPLPWRSSIRLNARRSRLVRKPTHATDTTALLPEPSPTAITTRSSDVQGVCAKNARTSPCDADRHSTCRRSASSSLRIPIRCHAPSRSPRLAAFFPSSLRAVTLDDPAEPPALDPSTPPPPAAPPAPTRPSTSTPAATTAPPLFLRPLIGMTRPFLVMNSVATTRSPLIGGSRPRSAS